MKAFLLINHRFGSCRDADFDQSSGKVSREDFNKPLDFKQESDF